MKSFLEYFFDVIRNVTCFEVVHRIPEIQTSLNLVVFAREAKNSESSCLVILLIIVNL